MILTPVGRLEGGHSSGGIEVLDAELEDGTVRRVLRKRTTGNEVRALLALRRVALRPGAVPELLDYGRLEGGGAWVLVPYYEGVPPVEVPDEVMSTLARVHAHHTDHATPPSGIIVIDPDWWHRLCLEVTVPALEEQGMREAAEAVAGTAHDERMTAALQRLPRTLLHGDMHEGNVISGPLGATIIDWGNARIGPQLLDVANIAGYRDDRFLKYAADWERLTGRPLENAEVGHALATAIINTQYLGFAARFRGAAEVAAMLAKRREALDRL